MLSLLLFFPAVFLLVRRSDSVGLVLAFIPLHTPFIYLVIFPPMRPRIAPNPLCQPTQKYLNKSFCSSVAGFLQDSHIAAIAENKVKKNTAEKSILKERLNLITRLGASLLTFRPSLHSLFRHLLYTNYTVKLLKVNLSIMCEGFKPFQKSFLRFDS